MIIRSRSLKKTSWKNGGGLTTEITRSGGDDFSWRVSFAEIAKDSAFSAFAGYDRALVIWKGNGIRLGGVDHLPFEPFYFSGDLVQESQLIEGPVVDLGVIYRRAEWRADMRVITSVADVIRGETNLLFVTNGELEVGHERLVPQDTFVFSKVSALSASQDFRAIAIGLIKK